MWWGHHVIPNKGLECLRTEFGSSVVVTRRAYKQYYFDIARKPIRTLNTLYLPTIDALVEASDSNV